MAERIDAAWETVTGETVSYREPNGGEAIDNQSIAEWLDGAECSGWFRKLLDVAYTTEYGLETGDQSAWNLLMMIDTEPDPFKIFGESDERFHVRGGNDLIPRRLAERLAGRIETGARLEAVAEKSSGDFLLTFRQGWIDLRSGRRSGSCWRCRSRCCATSASTSHCRRSSARRSRSSGYGTNAKLMVGFSERIWREPRGAGAANPGRTAASSPTCPSSSPGRRPGCRPARPESSPASPAASAASRSGRGRRRRSPSASPASSSVFSLEPPSGASAKRASTGRASSSPRGATPPTGVGQWTSIGGAEGERVGNLHFAGEHTSADFQGFMEGGCESGERVAGEILADLGIAPPAAGSA